MSDLQAERWVLIVEDNVDDEKLARRVFERIGRKEKLVVAHDGEEALRILGERPTPALVLLDLKLPRLSGCEVLTAIRDDDRLSCIPVVILTSSSEKTDLAACYALGCNSFVRKEIDYDRYVADLAIVFDFWLRINRVLPAAATAQAGANAA